jgi:thioredoxin reductase (NADPH)
MDIATYDFIIIGAGAAGLSAAIYAGRSRLSTLVIDSGGISGGQTLNILEVENYPGLFPAQSGSVLAETLEKQAQAFGAAFAGDEARSITKTGSAFTVSCAKKNYSARAVLLASGGAPRKLGVPGEEAFAGRGVSYCATCDGPFFRGKRVAVVGGGNSACDEAVYLSTLASRVTLIHRRDSFRADPLSVLHVTSEPKIDIAYNTVVKEIFGGPGAAGGDKVSRLLLASSGGSGERELEVDGVFIFAGFIPQTFFAPDAKKDADGYIITDENMQTSVPGLFCAGDARSKPLRQIVTAASDGAVAAHSAGKYLYGLSHGAGAA